MEGMRESGPKPVSAAAAPLVCVSLLSSFSDLVLFIRAEWQRESAVQGWDWAWASAKVSVYKTQKRYAFEKTSRCAAGRVEKR